MAGCPPFDLIHVTQSRKAITEKTIYSSASNFKFILLLPSTILNLISTLGINGINYLYYIKMSSMTTNFEVYVSKADFKFNAAHFVAFRGFRERLHGHNYTVGVRLLGSRKISHDGYVMDFGDVKAVVKKVCKKLNERFLCPIKSDVIDIQIVQQDDVVVGNNNNKSNNDCSSKSVILTCEDGAKFVMPHDDCAMLPIVHATVEELAIYVWSEILIGLDSKILRQRGIHTMEVVMAEAPGQEAVFRLEVPDTESTTAEGLDILSFIMNGRTELTPKPCLDQEQEQRRKDDNEEESKKSEKPSTSTSTVTTSNSPSSHDKNSCSCCVNNSSFSTQLEELASAFNKKIQLANDNDNGVIGEITAGELRSMLEKK